MRIEEEWGTKLQSENEHEYEHQRKSHEVKLEMNTHFRPGLSQCFEPLK